MDVLKNFAKRCFMRLMAMQTIPVTTLCDRCGLARGQAIKGNIYYVE